MPLPAPTRAGEASFVYGIAGAFAVYIATPTTLLRLALACQPNPGCAPLSPLSLVFSPESAVGPRPRLTLPDPAHKARGVRLGRNRHFCFFPLAPLATCLNRRFFPLAPLGICISVRCGEAGSLLGPHTSFRIQGGANPMGWAFRGVAAEGVWRVGTGREGFGSGWWARHTAQVRRKANAEGKSSIGPVPSRRLQARALTWR